MVIQFTVIGDPAPQGSKSFKGFLPNGKANMQESSKAVRPWRQDVAFAGREAMQGREPLDGPLMASIVFTVRKPASAPKRKTTYPSRKPDLDKLLRSTMDALVTAGVIADDARVVEFTQVAKVFPGEHIRALPHPGAYISVWRIEA